MAGNTNIAIRICDQHCLVAGSYRSTFLLANLPGWPPRNIAKYQIVNAKTLCRSCERALHEVKKDPGLSPLIVSAEVYGQNHTGPTMMQPSVIQLDGLW